MIVIPLLILATLYLALLIWVGYKLKSWPVRIAVLLVMLSPFIYWVGSYQYVKYEHEAACARDGGLKVLIRPEKADRIQLNAETYSESTAKYLLDHYSPQLVSVEAWDREYNGKGQKTGYFEYSPDPATTALPKKDRKFNKVPLSVPTAGLYVLSETATVESNLTTTTWKLERNGQLYAKWTMLHHYWSRNGGMPIGWQCFKAGSPEGAGRYPDRALTELILK